MKISFFIYISLLLLCGSCIAQTTTRIFIVRHADREASDDLNAAGRVRADDLKRMLLTTGVDSIFSTNFVRTKKTVQPLAAAAGLPVLLYDSNPPLLKRVLKYNKGNTLLVAGHSNTVAQLVRACGCNAPFENIPDTQFDNLFLVILQHPKKGAPAKNSCRLLHMKYGAPTL